MEQKVFTAEEWYEIGNGFRREGRFGDAINAYRKSAELNPDGPAMTAIEILNDILDYRNTDLINP